MAYITGLVLGLSLIISLGVQNLFVIRQALHREYHYLVALLCSLCDALLVLLSFTGAGLLIKQFPVLQIILWLAAIVFLLYFSLRTLSKLGKSNEQAQDSASVCISSRGRIIVAALAFSLLNPQAIIEMFVLIGGLVNDYPTGRKILFVSGVISASFIWFFSLSFFASRFSNFFKSRKSWLYLDIISSLLMSGLVIYFSFMLKKLVFN